MQTGGPVLDAYGYAAAALLPLAVWLTRICVGNEPPAARNCAAAAAGPGRVHLACVLTAAGAAQLLGLVGVVFVALLSDPHSADHRVAVPVLPAAGAGLLAATRLRAAGHRDRCAVQLAGPAQPRFRRTRRAARRAAAAPC